ncbi:MAG: hypothetical protein ABW161_14765 [Candidatus Thiodiazotropha sp.]
MIKYSFDISKFPDDLNWDSALVCEVESNYFSISINEVEVFSNQEFLVYELFDALHKWLIKNVSGKSDFYFVSMDEEEEPIVAFLYDEGSGNYHFESVFKLADAIVTFQDIVDSYQKFKTDLSDQLLKKYEYHMQLED